MDHLCLSRCIFEIVSGSPNADGVHKNVLLLLMLLTHFRITDPLFIYLFILLSTENFLSCQPAPAVKHREEKNVASVNWIH